MADDALGNPVRLIGTEGQVADVTQGAALERGIEAEHGIADKGHDNSELEGVIEAGGAAAGITPRSNRKEPREYNKQ